MTARAVGCVVRTHAGTLVAAVPGARIGAGVRIRPRGGTAVLGEIASVERGRATIVPFGTLDGVAVGDRVELDPAALVAPLGFGALGRALDPSGRPLDGGAAIAGRPSWVVREAPRPSDRRPVAAPFWTGVRAIDGLLTLGRGARVGIFGAPGAGKTTLLESIVAGARADAVVLALVGERGREAQAWFDRASRHTTIVCATSDRSAAERVRAAEVAMAQALRLRDHGLDVLLLVDSLARYCAALREQRIALGEPVGRAGYPPSVWADLARYLEHAGTGPRGSVTVLATVLSDGSDEREPLTDAARSLLDGHIALSGSLARAAHYPAIDILASTSRTAGLVIDAAHEADARAVRETLALLAETKDARDVGLAVPTPALAAALAAEPALAAFLQQRTPSPAAQSRSALRALAALVTAA